MPNHIRFFVQLGYVFFFLFSIGSCATQKTVDQQTQPQPNAHARPVATVRSPSLRLPEAPVTRGKTIKPFRGGVVR